MAQASSESGAAAAAVSGLSTLGSPLTPQTGDNLVNIMLKMARALDDQSVPEENRWFVAAPAFYETLFGAGAKFAEVQVTGDGTSPLRNGLVMQGNIAGFNCYKSTAMNATGTDTLDVTNLDATEFPILAGHISATATASHIAKTEVVRSTETFSDIVRGLHVFGRKSFPGLLFVAYCKGGQWLLTSYYYWRRHPSPRYLPVHHHLSGVDGDNVLAGADIVNSSACDGLMVAVPKSLRPGNASVTLDVGTSVDVDAFVDGGVGNVAALLQFNPAGSATNMVTC